MKKLITILVGASLLAFLPNSYAQNLSSTNKTDTTSQTNHSIQPQDILPDGADTSIMHGKKVRKATIAAFLANLDILENPQSTDEQKQQAIHTMKELAPAVNAIGLHKYVVFKNKKAEQILVDAE